MTIVAEEKVDTFLHQAAENGNLRQVKAAVENQHFDVWAEDEIGETPLHKAVRCGGMDKPPTGADYPVVVDYLLKKMEANKTGHNWQGVMEQCLSLAVFFAGADIVSKLLQEKIRLNQFTSYKMFADAAQRTKQPEIFQVLIDVLKPSKETLAQALYCLIDYRLNVAAKVLLDAGADPLLPAYVSHNGAKYSALAAAAISNDRKLIKLVISYIK